MLVDNDGLSEETGVWQKNTRSVDWTSVPLLFTVGRACRLSRGSRGVTRATDAIWLPNV
jgi:hypothetical protein